MIHPLSGSPNSSSYLVAEARVVAGSGGGPDKTILNTPRFLADTPYPTLCVYLRPPADPGFAALRAKARLWQAPLVEIDDRGPFDWRIVSALLQFCRRHRVAIWHGHDYKTNALGLLLRTFHRMHLVTTVHGWVQHTRRTPFYYWVDRLCLPRYQKVICVSEDLLQRCRECGVPPRRLALIENGIDTEEFRRRQSREEARRDLALAPTRFVFGAVGRLSPEKGFDLLLQALALLRRDGLDVSLLLVGEGDERPRLEQLVQQLQLHDRVHLLGYRSDTRPLYEAMDGYVLSSLREGLPNVLLEAMAMEVPVLATRIAGVPRLIHDQVNGLLVEPGNVEALAAGMRALVLDRPRTEQFARQARETIETGYSFRRRMEKIRELYDTLVAK